MNGIHIFWNSLFPLGNVYYVHEVKNDFFSLALQAKLEHILAFLAHSAVRHLPILSSTLWHTGAFQLPILIVEWRGMGRRKIDGTGFVPRSALFIAPTSAFLFDCERRTPLIIISFFYSYPSESLPTWYCYLHALICHKICKIKHQHIISFFFRLFKKRFQTLRCKMSEVLTHVLFFLFSHPRSRRVK